MNGELAELDRPRGDGCREVAVVMILELEHRTGPTRVGNYVVRVDHDGALYAHHNAHEPTRGDWTADPATTHHGAIAQPRATIDRVLRRHRFFELTRHPAPTAAQGELCRLTYWDPQGTARSLMAVADTALASGSASGAPAVDLGHGVELDRIIHDLLEALDLAGFPST